jgi:hypothetical protein
VQAAKFASTAGPGYFGANVTNIEQRTPLVPPARGADRSGGVVSDGVLIAPKGVTPITLLAERLEIVRHVRFVNVEQRVAPAVPECRRDDGERFAARRASDHHGRATCSPWNKLSTAIMRVSP